MNIDNKVNGEEIEKKALGRLKYLLGKISFVKDIQVKKNNLPGFYDGLIDLKIDKKIFRLVVEVKMDARPRDARNFSVFLDYERIKNNADYAVLVSRYISPQSAEICKENGIGYLDFAGNCHLSFGHIYIHQEGRPNLFVTKQEQRSLFHTKSERILRTILDPRYAGEHWTLRALASKTEPNVSLGQVHKVVQLLLDEEYLRETSMGYQIQHAEDLLSAWVKEYRFERNQSHQMFSLAWPGKLQENLIKWSRKEKIILAFASFSAAEQLAPNVRQPRLYFYIQGGPFSIPANLEVKPVESGANVILMEPYDEGVFHGMNHEDQIPVTGPIQTCLDVLSTGGRGEEAAEGILDEILKPAWKKAKVL